MSKDDTQRANVPRLRFPEFRDAGEWKKTQLGKHVQISSGGSPSQYSLSAAGTHPFVKVEDLNNCTKYQLNAREYCDDFDGAVSRGAVIFPKRGAAIELNKIRITGTAILIDTNMMGIMPTGGLNVEFLFYYISNVGLSRIADTSTIPQINNKHIIPLAVVLPHPTEQQKIADCLGSLDDLIAAEGRKLAALRDHKQGLMQRLFPREGETQPRLRFPEFRQAPGWEERPFGDYVTHSFYGTSRSTSDSSKYPVLRMGNLQDGGLNLADLVYIDLGDAEFASLQLKIGDILLNRTNSYDLVGKVSLFDQPNEFVAASYLVTYRLNEDRLVPSFCNAMLNTPQNQRMIKLLATKSVSQANINPTTFRTRLVIAVPALAEQQRIADCLSALDARIAAQSAKLDALCTHKRGLMQQLFPSPEGAAT